jgi:pimeloyl-ACP methyl ester carboxylesterase
LKGCTRTLLCVLIGLGIHAELHAQQIMLRRYALGGSDTIAVHETGEGPAVVFVPGLLGSSFSFRHLAGWLADAGHRAVVVDPLGTGLSSRPKDGDYTLEAQAGRVLAAMDSAGVGSALLVCHSVGGSICYRAALRSERVLGIVAVNAGPDEQAATEGLRSAMKVAPLIRILGVGNLRGRLRSGLIDSSADATWVTETVVEAYTAPFRDLGVALRGLRGIAAARDTLALEPRLDEIDIPIVLLVGTGGDEGPSMSSEEVARLRSRLPRLTVEHIDVAGQYIQEEHPAAIMEAIYSLRSALAADLGTRLAPH